MCALGIRKCSYRCSGKVSGWLVYMKTSRHQVSLAQNYDAYQAAVYRENRNVLTHSIAACIAENGAVRILDCSAGTGLPGLNLRAIGFDVTCTDADPDMLTELRRNACIGKIDDTCDVLRWSELPSLGSTFDYVMCRGNSLVYAGTWGDQCTEVAPCAALEDELASISAVVAKGGVLHVDAPVALRTGTMHYPGFWFRGSRVEVSETVTTLPGARRWDLSITIDDGRHDYVRYSTQLDVAMLGHSLRRVGFHDITPRNLPGERPSYGVLLARKS